MAAYQTSEHDNQGARAGPIPGRRFMAWLIGGSLGGAGAGLAGLTAIVGGVVLLAGYGANRAGSWDGVTPPAIATAMSRPAEWLPTAESLAPGIPNALTLATINAASDGQVFGDRYYCSNGQTAGEPCAAAYPGSQTVGIGKGLLGLDTQDVPKPANGWHDVTENLTTGLQRLAVALRQPAWKTALAQFAHTTQRPPGWTGSAPGMPDQIRSLVAQYAAGPTLGAWALADWDGKTGQWADPGNRPVWVFVVATAPVPGTTWRHVWDVTTQTVCNAQGQCRQETVPHWITGKTLAEPVQVWGTLANGQRVNFTLSTSNPRIPVWPDGVVWGAKVSLTGPQGLKLISAQWASGLRDTIPWPEQPAEAPGYVQVISNQQALNAWWPAIQVASQRTGVPAAWIAAEMLNESGGDANASVNGLAGAYGLMQLEPGTAQRLPGWFPGARQNPQENLILGAELLAELHTQFGSWRIASAAYYGGAGLVEAAGVSVGMAWPAAAARLNIVPDPGSGNTLTLAQYADNIQATAQWVATHAPKG